MSFATRGIIEGFYGTPWSEAARRRVLADLAPLGLTTYVHAPKDDPYQNVRWREPYPTPMERQLGELASWTAGRGIELVLGLRPLEMRFSDPADVERVIAKLHAHAELGVRSFMLLADDLPLRLDDPDDAARFAGLADAQAWLVGECLAALDGRIDRFIFCPTEYHGLGSSYVDRLGERLPAEVEVCWTGPEICSPTIDTGDAAAYSASIGRAPLVWDNYPVNDLAMVEELHIGPVRGREPDLASEVAGLLVNPALQPEASRIALRTYADYLADPVAYDADASWERALLAVTGDAEDAAAVRILAELLDCSVISQPWDEATLSGQPERQVSPDAAAAIDRLERLRNEELCAELAPWVAELRARLAADASAG